jgi:hypothetical protein
MRATDILRDEIELSRKLIEHIHIKLLQIIDVDEQREHIYDIEELNATIADCEQAIKLLEDNDE